MKKTKAKIIILHPHTELGRAYSSRLDLEGFDSSFFSNHDDALAHIQVYSPDLIIMAEKLKGITHMDMLDLLDSTELGYSVPVLVITDGNYSENHNMTRKDCVYIPKTAATSATVIAQINSLVGLDSIQR